MTEPPCEDFAAVVKEYLQLHTRAKAIRQEGKTVRERMESLKQGIISYMEQKELDVCRINQNGESGSLAVRVCKSTKSLRNNSAVQEIASWFDENEISFSNGTSSTKADEIWSRVQSTRESKTRKDIRLG